MKVLGPGLQTSTSLTGQQTPFIPLRTTPHPMMVLLFGKRPPRRIDARRYPSLKRALRKLRAISGQVAELVGRDEDDFPLSLCEGENAAIGQDSELFIGVDLLQEHERESDLLLGITGHEIGHKPWTWPRGGLGRLTRAQLNAMYREEEAKADRFAGRAFADLGGDPEPLCDFLLSHATFEGKKSEEYYPAPVRVRMIREAYQRRMRALRTGHAILGATSARTRELR